MIWVPDLAGAGGMGPPVGELSPLKPDAGHGRERPEGKRRLHPGSYRWIYAGVLR
jgi:hypothetical protein